MGNQSSNDKKERTLLQATDYIATNLILTQNFNDMKNLADMNYCDNLVILTSDAIDKNLDHLDVYFLSQRLKGGIETNEMSREKISYLKNKLII
jgi:serine kinase of HPr protein (carbohydrate metabolism regulator)